MLIPRLIEYEDERNGEPLPPVQHIPDLEGEQWVRRIYALLARDPDIPFSWPKLFLETCSLPLFPGLDANNDDFSLDAAFRCLGVTQPASVFLSYISDPVSEGGIEAIPWEHVCRLWYYVWFPLDDLILFDESMGWLLFIWHDDGWVAGWQRTPHAQQDG